MRNTRWLRYGLSSLVVTSAALGCFLVACSDDNDVGSNGTPDSGTTETGTTTDTGTPDTGRPDSGPTLPNAKLTIVNAATDLGASANYTGTNVTAVRICFALNGNITPLAPQPDRSASALPAGIPIGFGGAFPSFGLDLEPLTVTPYVMSAQRMAAKGIVRNGSNPGPTCDEILKPGGFDGGVLVENVDYWKLADIPAGTLKKDKSFALVLTGCTATADQANASGGRCGPDATFSDGGVGNLKVRIYEVDRETAVAANEFGAQFIHASPPAAAVPVRPAIVQVDGGSPKPIGDGGTVPFTGATAFTKLTGVTVDSDLLVVAPGIGQPLKGPTGIQAVSFAGSDAGAGYVNGAGYVFVAVGDPNQQADAGPGGFNGRTLHFLGFPTNPTIVPYQP